MEIVGRAALSLQFSDEQMYRELIAPLKSSKRLTPLIMQLLELYYYNEEFHNLAEQLSPNEEEGIADSYDDYFKDISAFIAVMGNMQDTLEDNVKEGLKNIIETSESREDIDSDIWGKPVPRVASNIENIREIETSSNEDNSRIQELEGTVAKLSSTVEELMSTLRQQNSMPQQPMYGMNMQMPYMQQPYMQTVQPMPNAVGNNLPNISQQQFVQSSVQQVSTQIDEQISEEKTVENNIEELEKLLGNNTSRNDETEVVVENSVNVNLDDDEDFSVNVSDKPKSDEGDTLKINFGNSSEENKEVDTVKAKSSLNKLMKSLK